MAGPLNFTFTPLKPPQESTINTKINSRERDRTERRLRILESGDRREGAELLHEIADKFRGERETGEVGGFLETGTDRGTRLLLSVILG